MKALRGGAPTCAPFITDLDAVIPEASARAIRDLRIPATPGYMAPGSAAHHLVLRCARDDTIVVGGTGAIAQPRNLQVIAELHRQLGQGRTFVDPHLATNIVQMDFHGALRDGQFSADLLVRISAPDQREHLALARSE